MNELQLLQQELTRLSPDEQESWAGWFRHELHALRQHDAWYHALSPAERDALRSAVEEGLGSGDGGLLDTATIKRDARARWEARQS